MVPPKKLGLVDDGSACVVGPELRRMEPADYVRPSETFSARFLPTLALIVVHAGKFKELSPIGASI